MNPWSVLGLRPDATAEERRRAYRRYVAEHHPDRGGDPDAFQAGVEAYQHITTSRWRVPGRVVTHHRRSPVEEVWSWVRAADLGEITRTDELNHGGKIMSRPTVVGLFTGLLLGLALVLGSFGDMLVVALFGAIGVVVVKVLEGELDLEDLAARTRRRRAP